jgi:aminoglycoside 6'-N-acetyltransferase I
LTERAVKGTGSVGARVRPAASGDVPALAVLRAELWPEGDPVEHASELPSWLADPDTCSLVAEADGGIVGFLEGRLRSHADGCATSPVGYLEGWYVAPGRRRRGVGRALCAAFEAWARSRGCRELASDTWPENTGSVAAHRRLGFEEVDRVVLFRKSLAPGIALPPSVRPPPAWNGGRP